MYDRVSVSVDAIACILPKVRSLSSKIKFSVHPTPTLPTQVKRANEHHLSGKTKPLQE
jgi:hypothetical protein